ncbi:hypothetical protein [Kribbella turkmenica]|nr:hypothetical protein [Kribbella turkmenica]
MKEALAGVRFRGLADQAFALEAGDGVGDCNGAGCEVELVPKYGE